jgi:hypothetical protein
MPLRHNLLSSAHLLSSCRQFRLLLRRSWRQITRDKAAAMARLSSNMSSAIIFGAIFWRMQKKQSNIQDRMGLLQVFLCCYATCYSVSKVGCCSVLLYCPLPSRASSWSVRGVLA